MKKTGFLIKLEWKNHPLAREPRRVLAAMLKVLGSYPSVECDNPSPTGYTPTDLRRHLEKLFQPGMSWENSDSWHLEHIVPIHTNVTLGIVDLEKIHALNNFKLVWDKPTVRNQKPEESNDARRAYNRIYMRTYRKRPEQLAYQREYRKPRGKGRPS
jgi:hypothetical protein